MTVVTVIPVLRGGYRSRTYVREAKVRGFDPLNTFGYTAFSKQ